MHLECHATLGWVLGNALGSSRQVRIFAVAGSILLLMRSRFAVWAFGLSLIGTVVGLIYGQFINPPPPLPESLAMMSYMPWVITAIAVFLAWYAWAMAKKGVLR